MNEKLKAFAITCSDGRQIIYVGRSLGEVYVCGLTSETFSKITMIQSISADIYVAGYSDSEL